MPPLHTGTAPPGQGLGHAGREGVRGGCTALLNPAPSALFLQLLLGSAPAHPGSCSVDAPVLCRAGTQLPARPLHRGARPSEFIPACLNLLDDEHGSLAVGVS